MSSFEWSRFGQPAGGLPKPETTSSSAAVSKNPAILEFAPLSLSLSQ